MELNYLIKGFIIGLSIAAPVGPMGVLVIRRTLAGGRWAGLVSGLGIASGDTLYGAVGAFGLTFITGILIGGQFWLRLAGGCFLGYLGLKTLLSRPAEQAVESKGRGWLGLYLSTFLLTLTNPPTILSFAAIVAALGIGSGPGSYFPAALIVAGVMAGSTCWWLILSTGVSLFRAKFNYRGFLWVNRVSGLVIITFGLLALISLL